MKYIILGNGAAGISAAEKLRQLDETCDIEVISVEDTPVYAKFMLPDYIGGKIDKEKLMLRDLDYYRKNEISLLLGEKIRKIDTNNNCVLLDEGSSKYYDKLLVAVGGRPVVPNIEGIQNMSYLTVNSIKDADILKRKAVAGQKAVVIGAGLSGIEITFALKRLGVQVTLVEREERLLPLQLDVKSSEFLVQQIKREGVDIRLNKNINCVNGDNEKYVEFSDGDRLEFDILIITIGTRPNLDVIRETDIKVNRGILVDEHMETSIRGIYGAGDVVEALNKQSTGYVSSYIWANALAQGKCAAYNMAGQPQEFSREAAINNTLRLRDIPFVSMGMINPEERGYESLVSWDEKTNIYKKIVIKDNRISGMVCMGDNASSNIIGEFIRKGIDISEIRHIILDTDFVSKYKMIKEMK